MSKNNLEKALEYYKDAEKLDPLNKDIYLNKGICYMQLVRFNINPSMMRRKRRRSSSNA
jgi:tetratricopeptide (TPR) repeat protein